MAPDFNLDSVKEFFENIIDYFKNLETLNLIAWIMIFIGFILILLGIFAF